MNEDEKECIEIARIKSGKFWAHFECELLPFSGTKLVPLTICTKFSVLREVRCPNLTILRTRTRAGHFKRFSIFKELVYGASTLVIFMHRICKILLERESFGWASTQKLKASLRHFHRTLPERACHGNGSGAKPALQQKTC